MSDGVGLNRFASIGYHRLAYEIVPSPQAEAPAIALLHGLLAGRAEWAVARAALVGAYSVILPEARGHGASAALSDRRYSIPEAARETLAVLDHAGVATVHLVGHGLGGAVAWEIARLVPGRVRSLSLVEPDLPALLDADLDPVAGSLRRNDREASRAAADAAYKGLVDQALAAYLSPRRGADWRHRLPRPTLAAYRRHASALPGLLDALDAHSPAVDDLDPALPVQVVVGSAGRPFVQRIAARLAAERAATRLESVPTADPTDSPLEGAAGEALANLVRTFVARSSEPDGRSAST